MSGELLLINPRRKRRTVSRKRRSPSRSRRRRVSYARRNPIANLGSFGAVRSYRKRRRSSGRVRRYAARARSGYRRAVSGNIGSFLTQKILPAGVGAGGALALDMLWPQLPLPDSLKAGPLAPAVRIAGAVGIGMIGRMVGGKRFGEEAMGGALIVTLYDLAKGAIASNFPSLPMNGMGAFVDGYDQLGWMSPAQQVGSRMGAFVE